MLYDAGLGMLTDSLALAIRSTRAQTAGGTGNLRPHLLRHGRLARTPRRVCTDADLLVATERALRVAMRDHEQGISALAYRSLNDLKSKALLTPLGKKGLLVFDQRESDAPGEAWEGKLRTEYLASPVNGAIDRLGADEAMLAVAAGHARRGGQHPSGRLRRPRRLHPRSPPAWATTPSTATPSANFSNPAPNSANRLLPPFAKQVYLYLCGQRRLATLKATESRMDIANSVNRVPIRLNYERWYHIVENHDEMASCFHDVLEAVERPELVLRGSNGALKAVRSLGKRKWLVAVYRELSRHDGFVITDYLLDTRPKGKIAWRRP